MAALRVRTVVPSDSYRIESRPWKRSPAYPNGLRHPAILALTVAAASVVLAKLVELFLCGALGRLARRTRTDFDEKLIDALHRPIFVSVLLLGVRMAVLILGPPAAVMSWTDSIVQTMAIFVWTVAGLRVVYLGVRAAAWP